MAKAKENAAPASQENNVVKDVMEEVKASNLIGDDLKQRALEEIQKTQDEKKIREIKEIVMKCSYRRELSLIKTRHQKKRKEAIALYQTRQLTRIERLYTGTTVDEKTLEYAKTPDDILNIEKLNEKDKTLTVTVDGKSTTYKVGDKMPGVITYIQADEMFNKIASNVRKMESEADSALNKDIRELDNKYRGFDIYDWRF